MPVIMRYVTYMRISETTSENVRDYSINNLLAHFACKLKSCPQSDD